MLIIQIPQFKPIFLFSMELQPYIIIKRIVILITMIVNTIITNIIIILILL